MQRVTKVVKLSHFDFSLFSFMKTVSDFVIIMLLHSDIFNSYEMFFPAAVNKHPQDGGVPLF